MDYMVEGISEKDSKMNLAVTRLLEQEGIQRDGNLDYTCVILDDIGKSGGHGKLLWKYSPLYGGGSSLSRERAFESVDPASDRVSDIQGKYASVYLYENEGGLFLSGSGVL